MCCFAFLCQSFMLKTAAQYTDLLHWTKYALFVVFCLTCPVDPGMYAYDH